MPKPSASFSDLSSTQAKSVTAVLDGYAVFQKCASASDIGDPLLQIVTVDAASSELVLALEKDGQKVEVARGDELTTWRMLEGLEISLPTDGTTGWLANGGRLVWSCETLKGEHSSFPGRTSLTRAVANYYFKLMAIKDEYEVARLYTDTGFLRSVERKFEGDFKLVFNLAPPVLSKRDPATGEPKKREFGQWVIPAFRLLAKLRFLRGTALDVFGHTQERRTERALIAQYKSNVDQALSVIASSRDAGHYDTALELAELPETIRGYGHVRARGIQVARQQELVLLEALQRRVIPLKAAA